MIEFTFDGQRSRVVFGEGSISSLPDEIVRLGCERALIVSTPGRAEFVETVRGILGERVAGSFDRAVVHVPADVAVAAREAADACRADCIVALGGGSAIGLAKAIALSNPLPTIAIPTTYSGSEMTPVWGLTRGRVKETGRDARVQPRAVIYDPVLTIALSQRTTGCSGLNAVAHCVEALYAADANPLTGGAAMQGLMHMCLSLPALTEDPGNLEHRASAMKGAWLAGFALGTVGMGLHHKLCHTLGGSFDLPHSETHAVLLPYTAAFNREAADIPMHAAAQMLNVPDLPAALVELATIVKAPLSLGEIGFREADIESAAELASQHQYPNPRVVTREGIRELLTAAFRGDADYVTTLAAS